MSKTHFLKFLLATSLVAAFNSSANALVVVCQGLSPQEKQATINQQSVTSFKQRVFETPCNSKSDLYKAVDKSVYTLEKNGQYSKACQDESRRIHKWSSDTFNTPADKYYAQMLLAGCNNYLRNVQ